MAHIDYAEDGYDGYGAGEVDARGAAQPVAGSRLGTLVNWAGALMSLGLVLGMGVWAFQLMMRDVSGVPVIEALEGPMREPPADPGGTQAPHQGLAVNRIAEGEEAQPVPDRLVLAPPPIELQEVRFETSEEADLAPVPRSEVAADTPHTATREETMQLIDRLLQEAQPGAPAPESVAVATEAPAEDRAAPFESSAGEPQVLPASAPGVARSLRPAARPAAFVTRADAGAPGTVSARSTPEIPVSELPDGTRLVQLGAFDTPDIAREEWDRIASRFPDYFDARPRVIEEAESGGQTFYRLRAAGFDDLAGSRRFCAVLVAEGTPCIPVTVR
jgi:hypothetical protein